MTASRTAQTIAPPISKARRWLTGRNFAPDRPLIDVSQAAPVDPPPLALREEMARLVRDFPDTHLYGAVLGLRPLREEIAAQWSRDYGGTIHGDQVAITAGCNQAFAAAISTLTTDGDAVMLPTPYYFNHAMWLQMEGVAVQPLPTGPDLLPDPDEAARRITPDTRAIALVSPNNPGGIEYPATLVRAFFDLARDRGIALILDETYRDFDSREGAPHDLFADPDWDDTLIHLYSFSKAYRLTGHRVGAMVASHQRLAEAEKFLDTVAICAPQLGQHAALWGLRHLGDWKAGERTEILFRAEAMRQVMKDLPGWTLLGCGAYFAYVRHPFAMPSEQAAERLVTEASVLMLPGSMFEPASHAQQSREMRIAFANLDRDGIAALGERLGRVTLR